jgi:hypothetical protein
VQRNTHDAVVTSGGGESGTTAPPYKRQDSVKEATPVHSPRERGENGARESPKKEPRRVVDDHGNIMLDDDALGRQRKIEDRL